MLAREIATSAGNIDAMQLEDDIAGCVENDWMSDEVGRDVDVEDEEAFRNRTAAASAKKETLIASYRATWVSLLFCKYC